MTSVTNRILSVLAIRFGRLTGEYQGVERASQRLLAKEERVAKWWLIGGLLASLYRLLREEEDSISDVLEQEITSLRSLIVSLKQGTMDPKDPAVISELRKEKASLQWQFSLSNVNSSQDGPSTIAPHPTPEIDELLEDLEIDPQHRLSLAL